MWYKYKTVMDAQETKTPHNDSTDLMLKTAVESHEQVLDLAMGKADSPLQGFIAVHNTFLGPALGGTRLWKYANKEEALKDALKLSKSMTYKCAIAGLPFGGGKGVIIYNPGTTDLEQVLQLYAEKVSLLNGRFYTGEDVGMTEENVQYMLRYSQFFIGKTGQAGDPSNFAALSTFNSIKVALHEKFGTPEIKGRKFVVKGVGKTGDELVRLLYLAGGEIFVSDTNPQTLDNILVKYPGIKEVDINRIEEKETDVFCPCALGDDITEKNVSKISASIIAGTANNQLENDQVSELLFKKGILYVPDYIANSGGLINVADELLQGGYSNSRVMSNIQKMKETLTTILYQSKIQKLSPNRVADKIAESRFKRPNE